ncbi:carbon starvation protein A [Egibacter rhizosphaerae]|uniref:Carbon starvation protein A n=1 Tax=Egibacter rhizosphaerae TaxID=1670831 RepID=A0A411YKN8_9ACTN|nr:carbon starvation protein A [Egibacter rhizosphaerae]QBI21784.1 carbon starvation protein A [Egibacter rhizosphaerae]
MPALAIAIVVFLLYGLGYRYYSKYLAEKVYGLEEQYLTPSHEFRDGVDFLPTNKHVLFGHHFTSVAGAAPIVGPAIAVVWGWLPALIWVVLGTIFASGAHDFGSIAVSVRHRARNIGTLAQDVISNRSRTLFLLIIFFLLTLVNAVFAIVISNLFVGFPEVIIPIFVEIPLAIAVGQYVYRKQTPALVPSLIGVAILYATIPLGNAVPIALPETMTIAGLELQDVQVWVLILFLYAGIASRIPVWILLQPRDYINSHQLFIALAVIFLGVIGFTQVVLPEMTAPAINPDVPDDAPPMIPFLFVIIACGAISGFHSLVASGTTAKQLDKETDARYVGYMGSLGEGSLALGAILATGAGLAIVGMDWSEAYASFESADAGAVGNFVEGVGGFGQNLGMTAAFASTFAALVVVSFAATTLDTGLRLQRYVIQEIGGLAGITVLRRNLALVTVIATLIPLALAWFRDLAFEQLWQLFGTTNQLTAGLALSVIAVWVFKRRRNPIAQIVPLVFLLVMTVSVLVINTWSFVVEGEGLTQWLLGPMNVAILVLAIWLVVEAVLSLIRMRGARREEPVDAPDAPSHQ